MRKITDRKITIAKRAAKNKQVENGNPEKIFAVSIPKANETGHDNKGFELEKL